MRLLISHIPLFPDRFIASGSQPMDDLLYGSGQHEVTVPLSNKSAKPAGHLHLGLTMERVAGPGEQIGEGGGANWRIGRLLHGCDACVCSRLMAEI